MVGYHGCLNQAQVLIRSSWSLRLSRLGIIFPVPCTFLHAHMERSSSTLRQNEVSEEEPSGAGIRVGDYVQYYNHSELASAQENAEYITLGGVI